MDVRGCEIGVFVSSGPHIPALACLPEALMNQRSEPAEPE